MSRNGTDRETDKTRRCTYRDGSTVGYWANTITAVQREEVIVAQLRACVRFHLF